jgi:NADPH:quinone reductase-like Zn-dependent oxidoreductase
VRAAVPGGVDLLFDAAGGQTGEQAVAAVRDGGRAIFLVMSGARQLERGITGGEFGAQINTHRLAALSDLVDAGKLRPQIDAVLPLNQVHEALERIAGRHTRGKIILQLAS